MRLFISVLLISFSGLCSLYSQNLTIQQRVNQVSGDTLFDKIYNLQQFDRTSSTTDKSHVHYLLDELNKYHFDTIFQQAFSSSYPPNLVAVKYGALYPDSFYIAGAHYDAATSYAGADDNASGTAGILEIARVLDGINLNSSLMLILFSAEEAGLVGSDAFLKEHKHTTQILGMLNMDMISYVKPGDDTTANVCFNTLSRDFKNRYLNASTTYVPDLILEPDSASLVVGASDHSSFWNANIPAFMLCSETDIFSGTTNPYYHSAGDTVGAGANCPFLTELIVKSATAFLLDLTLSIQVSPIDEIALSRPINIYPNPSTGWIRIQRNCSTPSDIRITDMTGRLAHQETMTEQDHMVNLSGCHPGVYIVRIITNQDIYTQKILIK